MLAGVWQPSPLPDEPPELELLGGGPLPENAIFAPQSAAVPTLDASQIQIQGPVPETSDAVPDEQRPVVGVLVNVCPFDGPHMPLTAVPPELLDEPELDVEPDELDELELEEPALAGAEHCAVLPPVVEAQFQVQ